MMIISLLLFLENNREEYLLFLGNNNHLRLQRFHGHPPAATRSQSFSNLYESMQKKNFTNMVISVLSGQTAAAKDQECKVIASYVWHSLNLSTWAGVLGPKCVKSAPQEQTSISCIYVSLIKKASQWTLSKSDHIFTYRYHFCFSGCGFAY